MARVVTVCFGVHNATCVHAPSFGEEGSFRKGAYEELIWAKWRMLHSALTEGGAASVLFLDNDVVLFRNPFLALQGAPDYDIRFQSEFACQRDACQSSQPPPTCHLNGGVLLLRSASFAELVIRRGEPDFAAAANDLQTPKGVKRAARALDQDTADAVMRTGQFRACHLPSEWFVGFCSWMFGYNKGNRSLFDALRPCEIIAYHGHCLVGAGAKLASMQRMLNKTRHCDGDGASRVVAQDASREVLGMWGPKEPPWLNLKLKKRALRKAGNIK